MRWMRRLEIPDEPEDQSADTSDAVKVVAVMMLAPTRSLLIHQRHLHPISYFYISLVKLFSSAESSLLSHLNVGVNVSYSHHRPA